jgi:HD-GYP domain-containing protein (c-di-GMP phosphodiesterase class II)
LASLLHDVGKTQLPRALTADADPTPERQEMIKQHVPLGLHLLNELPEVSKDLLAAVVQHHEYMDASGYPLALSGDTIHFYARIVAVANRLSHFADDPSGLNPFKLAESIKSEMFTKFDPAVCDTFIRYFNDYLMNNPVRLSDGRIARVVFLPSVNPTSPVLKTDNGEFIDIAKNKDVTIKGLTF